MMSSSSSSWTSVTPSLMTSVLSVLKSNKFVTMTPVQTAVIPLILTNKDVAVEAVTGSGKTLAFIVPIIQILANLSEMCKSKTYALILSPTRELAWQIHSVLQLFLGMEHNGRLIKSMLLVGGNKVLQDLEKFKRDGAQVLVATPGRLEDVLNGNTLGDSTTFRAALKSVEVLVLDEADRLLSMGFERALSVIMSHLPKRRRTSLFSATQTQDVKKLVRAGLREPVLVSVQEKPTTSEDRKGDEHMTAIEKCKTPSTLENFYVICRDPTLKLSMLLAFLKSRPREEKLLVFVATCACVEYIAEILTRSLKSQSKSVLAIHGKKSNRGQAFQDFQQADSGILVCTDVMARGIDVPKVHWVLQFDPPSNAEAFVHRCGRTARIGNRGQALLFLLPSEDAYVTFIKRNQQVLLSEMEAMSEEASKLSLTKILRDWQRNDRRVFDMANRAFVSFIQAYNKHECRYILRLKDLPIGELATAYGLLRMPKMPELKKVSIKGFQRDPKAVDLNDIKYKDKQREESRQSKLEVYRATGSWPGMKGRKREAAWSEKIERKRRKNERKEKKEKKDKSKNIAPLLEDDDSDEEEMRRDAKLLKKGKKRKGLLETFDAEIGLDDLGDDDSNQNLENQAS